MITIMLSIAGGVGLLLVLSKLDVLSYIFDTIVSRDGIDFTVLHGVTIYKLPYSEISQVTEVRWGGFWILGAYNYFNRFLSRKFLIEKKAGAFTRKVIISPRDPVEFKHALQNAGIDLIELRGGAPNAPGSR